MEKQTLAIIGAGPSGILAAKYALEQNYKIVLFEKTPSLGGIWSSKGYAWPMLTAIASKYTLAVPYYQWFHTDEIYPIKDTVYSYFAELAEDFNIVPHIKYEATVNLISQNPDNSFNVDWTSKAGENKVEKLDKVIVALGKLNGLQSIRKIQEQAKRMRYQCHSRRRIHLSRKLQKP